MKLLSIFSLILLSTLSVQTAPSLEGSGEDMQATAAAELSFTTSNGTLDGLLKELGLHLDLDGEVARWAEVCRWLL